MLVRACGGLDEAAALADCRVKRSMLADYQSPQGEAFMPADVMAALEAHCGEAIYSRALAEGLSDATAAACLTDEAMEATETVADLQRRIRLAAADGTITPRERAELMAEFEGARAQLNEVGALLAREA